MRRETSRRGCLPAAGLLPERGRSKIPPLAHRFVSVIYETARWANANHEQSAAILTKISRIDPEMAAHMHRAVLAESLTPELLQPQLTWAARLKFTDSLVQAKDLIFKV